MQKNDWVGDIKRLWSQGSVWVVHNPMIPRYWRAEAALGLIVANGVAIGWRACVDHHDDSLLYEVAVWSEHEGRGFLDEECGYYCVFRIGYFAIPDEMVAETADLFCFYDGQNPSRDDPNNPRLFSMKEAVSFMRHNFPEYEVIND